MVRVDKIYDVNPVCYLTDLISFYPSTPLPPPPAPFNIHVHVYFAHCTMYPSMDSHHMLTINSTSQYLLTVYLLCNTWFYWILHEISMLQKM